MKVYVSTLNFGFGPLPQLLRKIGGPGYSAVEISSGHPSSEDAEEAREATLKYRREHNASVILHNFAPPEPGDLLINLADPDPVQRGMVVRFLKSRIDLTKELGSNYYSFHGGYRVPYRFGVNQYTSSDRLGRDQALEIFSLALKEVVAYAEAREVHVGVENHVLTPGNEHNLILYNQADFKTIFDQVQSDYLHLHLDVGHLKVTSQTLQTDAGSFIDAFQNKVMAVHLHDNDGTEDEHQPFVAGAWFLEQLPKLHDLQIACLETKSGGQQPMIRRMENLLKVLR